MIDGLFVGRSFVSRPAAVSYFCALERGEQDKAYCERLVDRFLREGVIHVGPPRPDARVADDGFRYEEDAP